MRQGRLPKNLASKPKKLELNSTNLEPKSKKTGSDCAKEPDPCGVVHANVGQKLLICYPFKSFLQWPLKSFEHRIEDPKLLQTQ